MAHGGKIPHAHRRSSICAPNSARIALCGIFCAHGVRWSILPFPLRFAFSWRMDIPRTFRTNRWYYAKERRRIASLTQPDDFVAQETVRAVLRIRMLFIIGRKDTALFTQTNAFIMEEKIPWGFVWSKDFGEKTVHFWSNDACFVPRETKTLIVHQIFVDSFASVWYTIYRKSGRALLCRYLIK